MYDDKGGNMKRRLLLTVLLIMALMITACGSGGTTEAGTNETRYSIDYCGKKDSFGGAEDSYRPGQKVTLTYSEIATDTDYSFVLDGDPVNTKYDEAQGFILTFNMPDHDAKLEVITSSGMTALDPDKTEAKTEATPGEPITVNIGKDGTNATGTSGPITVEYYEDAEVDAETTDELELFNDEYSKKIIIKTSEDLNNFRILGMGIKDVDDKGNALFEYQVIAGNPLFDHTRALAATVSFYGDAPNIGIAYTDSKSGEDKVYAVYPSGKDGSLVINDITGFAEQRVSFEAADIMNAYSQALMGIKGSEGTENVAYLVQDLNGDKISELLLYEGDELREIYGYDGTSVVYSLGCSPEAELHIFDDGMAAITQTAENEGIETIFRFHDKFGIYLPVAERRYLIDENNEPYQQDIYTFAVEDDLAGFEEAYKVSHTWPEWAAERGDDLTEEEFNSKKSKGKEIKLESPKPLKDFNGF